MGVFDLIKSNNSIISRANQAMAKMSQQVANQIRHIFSVKWSYAARRDALAYLELFHTSPRFNAVDIIASDCANTVFKVYKKADLRTGKDDAEAIADHPIYDLMENPIPSRPDIDGFTIRYLIYAWTELQGDCYWIIVKDRLGQPREIYPIPSNWVIQTPTESMPYFLVVPQGNTASQSLLIDPADVVWFKTPNVVQPYARGRGTSERVGDEIESDEFAAKYAKNFFWNDATPRSIITAPGATDQNVKQLKETWNQQFQGVANAQKMGVLGWDAKLLQLSTNPKEMDFNATRTLLRDMVNQNWQMPPEILGILTNSNRSTIDAAWYMYSKNVLSKRLLRFESAINRQLMPMFDKNYAIKCDNIVPEDKEFALTVANAGWSAGTLTRGEWRTKVGMEKLGSKLDDEIVLSFNQIPQNINEPSPGPVPVLDPNEQQGGDTNIIQPVKPPPVAMDEPLPADVITIPPVQDTPGLSPVKSKSFTNEQKSSIWNQFDKAATAQEYPFKKAVKKVADYQQKEFNREFEDLIGSGLSPDMAIESSADKVFGESANNYLKRELYASWMDSQKAGLSLANSIADTKIEFNVVQPVFKKWIETNGLKRATLINETTKQALSKSLSDGIQEGETILELQNRVKYQFDGLRDYRSERIARTESAATFNSGALETYKSAGIAQKEWVSTIDNWTRQDHLSLNSKTIDIGDDFNVGGDTMPAPGLGSDPANNINCRCTIIPVIKEQE